MALPGIPIPETQCIGDSLFSINNALTALDSSVIELINAGASVTVSTTAPGGASLGDLWYDSDNGILSVYYDLQWVDVGAGGGGSGGATVTTQDTPPSGPSNGDLWFDSSSGVTFIYYDSQWIDVGGGDSGTSAGSVNGIVKSDGAGNFSAAVAGTDYLTSATLGSSPATIKAWAVFDPFVGFNNIYGYPGSTAGAIASNNINSLSRAAWTGIGWPGVVPNPSPTFTLTFPSGLFSGSEYFVNYTFSKGSGLQAENLASVNIASKTATSITFSMTNIYNAQTNTGDNLANYRIHVFFFGA